MTTTGPTWVVVGYDVNCDTAKGEVYMKQSPGKLPNIEACQKACEADSQCKSIAYFNNRKRWCSHYSTACTKTVFWKKSVALRLIRAGNTKR